MPGGTPRRRLSAILDQFKRFTNSIKSDQQYRSLSTGDLVSSKTSRPAQFEPDFVEMEFGNAPTTSKLPAHFDDCDMVPVEFGKNGRVRLLPQGSKEANETIKSANMTVPSRMRMEDIHKAQSWFFVDIDKKKAERILQSNSFTQESFLISYHDKKYVLSLWRGACVEHLIIRCTVHNNEIVFMLDWDKKFRNLVDLTEYYMKNKSSMLHGKLSKGVSRPRRNPDLHRSRA